MSITLALGSYLLAAAAPAQLSSPPSSKRNNELTLAGLRPGRDTQAAALRRYNKKYLLLGGAPQTGAADWRGEWFDGCRKRALVVESGEQSLVEEITVSDLSADAGKCDPQTSASLDEKDWATGRGLRLGDTRQRVIQLYGPPDSSGPSVRGATQLDFLYYAFDWAGPEVPQVLEVYCAHDSGRVLEMTLAFPSL